MKPIKVLHQWPLSKVELARAKGEFYVLKTIHKDFIKEIDRQKAIHAVCKKIGISRILLVRKNKGTVSFLMDYVSHKKKKVQDKLAIKLIREFHAEAQHAHRAPFRKYNFKAFCADFKHVKTHLPESLRCKNKIQLKEFFARIFDSNQSVVHGDWHADQIIITKDKECIIDFGKSFWGPTILDYGNYFAKTDSSDELVCKRAGISRVTLLKAKIVAGIIVLAWFELCKAKYVPYNYRKEIREYANLIRNNVLFLNRLSPNNQD
ncbi:phosphotransferase [Candidatus Woesearchaeota archaeon]|nr:phosphotransferase [Candidatus Woesearchaeota archaeon]